MKKKYIVPQTLYYEIKSCELIATSMDVKNEEVNEMWSRRDNNYWDEE